jgi:malonate-semialdehyde dehydrogenase (acetylating) / methylmalonate-semialdehyde dehydrogenase
MSPQDTTKEKYVARSYVNGASVSSTSGRKGPIYNPALGLEAGEVEFASLEEVDRAIAAAEEAFPAWSRMSLARRADIMFNFRRILKDGSQRLAEIVTSEHGKVLSDSLGEVARGLENVDFACGLPTLLRGGQSTQASTGVDILEIRQPLGVVAGITPFNFPVMVPLWMTATALACGNTMIVKPSERDPSASVLLAEMLSEAGVPDGVFNVVQGDREAVDRLLTHPSVAAISFVGSTPVARHIYETGSAHGKRVQALGGAKNHMVVMPDADIDTAADAAVSAAFGSAGERCMAVSVLVPVGGIADQLVEAIELRAKRLNVGDGHDAASEMGPLITPQHLEKVTSYVTNATDEGATVVLDGRDIDAAAGPGFFLGPSLIDNVTQSMKLYQDEIFGPVLSVVRADTLAEAIDIINANPYGNGVAIFTNDGAIARTFQLEIQAGMVGVNVPIPVPSSHFSFGGWKNSLFGDTHIYGHEGIHFYTRTKVVTSRWVSSNESEINMSFPTN